ncbi:Uncharacterised protein [Escherichia coli]|uniref:Uncharacterized protein n=1 Tax=Escherichia coli TaxID=562 RepID=A0A3S4KRC8_ECOLX|nr:Uncharacterised protein [Escherichia coli]
MSEPLLIARTPDTETVFTAGNGEPSRADYRRNGDG